jgi:hypothetical protein
MRNPDRLDSFYDEVKKIHKQYFPDWRFGQLFYNFSVWVSEKKGMDLFFHEENVTLAYLKEFASIYGSKNHEETYT